MGHSLLVDQGVGGDDEAGEDGVDDASVPEEGQGVGQHLPEASPPGNDVDSGDDEGDSQGGGQGHPFSQDSTASTGTSMGPMPRAMG